MNWLQRTGQQTVEEFVSLWENKWPVTSGVVSGLQVVDDIPNMDSIGASIEDYEILPGIREIPMSAFGSPAPRDNFYAADDVRRSQQLTETIRQNGWIAPLIVGVDAEGPYILEGIHRFVALGGLGVASLPALVVLEIE